MDDDKEFNGAATEKDGKVSGIAKITTEVREVMKGLKKINLVAVGLCLALLTSTCIPQAEAAPAKEIKIGMRAILSGALASTTVYPVCGFMDGIRYINEEEGGIDGVKINLLWEDTRGSVASCIMAHRRFKAAGIVLEHGILQTPTVTLAPAQAKDEIPLLYCAEYNRDMIIKPHNWIFSLFFGAGPEFIQFIKWVKQNWTEQRPPRVGIIFHDEAAGWEIFEARQLAGEIGVEFVGHEVIPLFGAIDTSVEWLRLVGKKPDWVYVCAVGATLVTLLKDAYRLEVQQKGVDLCTYAPGLDETIARAAGEKAIEGWHISKPHPPAYAKGIPGVDRAVERARRYRGWGVEDICGHYILLGEVVSRVTAEVLRMAIQKVGYENVTGRAVRDAMASLRDFEVGGIVPSVSWSEDQPYLIRHLRYYQVQQGRMVPVTEFFEFDRSYDYKELGGRF